MLHFLLGFFWWDSLLMLDPSALHKYTYISSLSFETIVVVHILYSSMALPKGGVRGLSLSYKDSLNSISRKKK
jgi:hypothetical protein